MSVPNGPTAPSFSPGQRIHDEIMAHRTKVYEVLCQHSDPAIRQIGRLLANGTATPHQLSEDPRRAEEARRGARKLLMTDPDELRRQVFGKAGGSSHDRTGPTRSDEGGPASRSNYTDPDNGAGGVPAVRR